MDTPFFVRPYLVCVTLGGSRVISRKRASKANSFVIPRWRVRIIKDIRTLIIVLLQV